MTLTAHFNKQNILFKSDRNVRNRAFMMFPTEALFWGFAPCSPVEV